MAPKTQEEIYKELKSKLAPPENAGGVIPNLLKVFTSLPATPMMSQETPQPTQSNAVSSMIPDTGKIETNLAKNELMAKHPGLGAK